MPCRCKQAAEGSGTDGPTALVDEQGPGREAAARRLGLHYLQRYFLLITFFAFLDTAAAATSSFARWVGARRELKHLLSTLSFEPAI